MLPPGTSFKELTWPKARKTRPGTPGQVVRRVLVRRNIAIDAETAQLAAAQAASRPPRRTPRAPATGCHGLIQGW